MITIDGDGPTWTCIFVICECFAKGVINVVLWALSAMQFIVWFFKACINDTWMVGFVVRYWSILLVNSLCGFWWDGDRFTTLMLLPSMWPTFPTMPKLINLVIIMSPISKFAFCASWGGSKFRPSQYPSLIKSQMKITSILVLGLALNSSCQQMYMDC